MFCPNCGVNNSTEQKFCRACGLNLEKTAASMLEQMPSAESAELLKRRKNLEKFGSVAFGGLTIVVSVAVGAIIYLIFTKVILSGNSVFGGILLIAFIVFGLLTLAYVAFSEDLKERLQKTNPAANNELSEQKETAKLLTDKSFEPISSVTENSTELLYAENKTKKL